MNWRNNFRRKFLFSICLSILVFLVSILLNSLLDSKIDSKITQLVRNNTTEIKKQAELVRRYSEISPDGLYEIILYERIFTGDREFEYKSYLNNKYAFVVKEFNNGVEREIYIGDDHVGYPHWLGNDFIFFTGGCGTGCRGFYLVNIHSKQSYNGVITTTPITRDSFTTHLKDWFDEEFEFPGFDENIRSVYMDSKAYLIFEMWNDNQAIGEKRFLFTGNSLKEL